MSHLQKAKKALLIAAQEYEDACHENETNMDACVESAKSNEMAKALRVNAVNLNNQVKHMLKAH